MRLLAARRLKISRDSNSNQTSLIYFQHLGELCPRCETSCLSALEATTFLACFIPSIIVRMAPRKRKADAAMQAEPSDDSPHKRARSESIADIVKMKNGIPHSSNGVPDGRTEHSTPIANPLRQSRAAGGKKNQSAPVLDLPRTWDQVSAADKMLVDMKDIPKISWARIESCWERSTGEKPANGMLRDRYRRLKDIMAESKGASEKREEAKSVEEPFEISEKIPPRPTTNVRSPSPVIDGPLDESSRSTVTKPSENANAAPVSEVIPEQDIPQSWEQANAGDQRIVRMKTSRKPWIRVEEEWQQLTGERPAKGALRDRYRRMKDLVIPPKTNGVNKHMDPVEVSTSCGASDQAISRRAKTILKSPRKRKAKVEPSDETSDEASDESSHEDSKRSMNMSRRKTRGAVEEQTGASAPDTQSDGPIAKSTRSAAAEPSDGRVEARSSHESDEISKPSLAVAKSTKRPRVKPPVAAASEAQSTAETADDMLVEMKESGYNWVDISKAWTERTGLMHAPETLRKRYASIKNGCASKLLSITSASSKRKGKAASLEEGSYERSTKRTRTKVESPCVAETPVKRNMDRGKRKSSVKYTDSTTDEDELCAAPIEPAATAPTPARRRAGRAAKVDRSDPEWLVTNEKSPLAQEDLHAEFSNPKIYENFTKSDWEDLRETLPPNVPVNPDGYSIPMKFFKYDPDFRRGIREFQEDLGSGRLDPKWQADAARAMEARARGDFDAYKEEQFEAFWGQKQKLNHDALAGESTKIKLDLLIQNGLFKLGDYFSYSRVVGRGKNGVLIEKECKVSQVLDFSLVSSLTF